jgi:hypothetical protein
LYDKFCIENSPEAPANRPVLKSPRTVLEKSLRKVEYATANASPFDVVRVAVTRDEWTETLNSSWAVYVT